MPHPTIHAVCLASSGRALSGTCSGPAAFVNNRKKTSLHESILSGIKARFGALARYAAALDEKAAARLSAADHPQQAAKQLETLLRLPETGTLLHFEAGDDGTLFLWQPALRMGTGLSLHGLPIRIANLTALCKTAGLSVDTITTEGEVVCLCARNTPQR